MSIVDSIYRTAWRIGLGASGPALLPALLFDAWDLRSRLTPEPVPRQEGYWWWHGASAGEVTALARLWRELDDRSGKGIFSACTASGTRSWRTLGAPEERVRILPADIPSAWKRTFRYEAPNLLLLSESELWWTWFKQLASKHCPIVLISANIAIETARVLSMSKICFDIAPNMYVAAQSEAVRCRFGSIGVPDDHIVVSGSLKWHCLPPISRQDMRSGIGVAGDEPVVVFGSARRGELRTFATALRGVHDAIPESRFIIAPRHSRDYDYAERIVRETGLALQRLSTIACGAEWFAPCMIVDSHGFLSRLYAVADVSVIGGSWVPVGGHNPFEAAVYGFPLLYGPFMQQTGCTFLEGSGQAVRIDAAKGALQSALMGILGIPSRRYESFLPDSLANTVRALENWGLVPTCRNDGHRDR